MRKIFIIGAAVMLSGLVLGACQTSDPSGDVGRGSVPDSDVVIYARDNTFDKTVLEGRAGDAIVVEVKNLGDTNHEFRVEDLGLTTGTIEPGETAHARLRIPKGVTEFQCSYHGGMDGVIEGG
ncbi:MAG TPA: cupredoxin domain-containing protein [Actinomycetota bacterium]|jgi:plastocyanin|nr:cupredoxin domain-containing protein [Actinomycetota bacterium]